MRSRVTWGLGALVAVAAIVFAVPVAGLASSSSLSRAGSLDANPTGTDPGSIATGKKVYIQFCGKCHALKAAGAKGTLGPNLDQDAVTYTRVVTAIEEGVGGIQAEYVLRNVTFAQVYDVAKYVIAVRAAGGSRGEYD